jgi:hypothetical protein
MSSDAACIPSRHAEISSRDSHGPRMGRRTRSALDYQDCVDIPRNSMSEQMSRSGWADNRAHYVFLSPAAIRYHLFARTGSQGDAGFDPDRRRDAEGSRDGRELDII